MNRFGYASVFVRRYIRELPLGRIFTTREFLSFGSRAAIDQALYRLVKDGRIIRLARGMFVRQGTKTSSISANEVAQTKARAFGREITSWGGAMLAEMGLSDCTFINPTYATTGGTSSFRFGAMRIFFKKAAARNVKLGDSIAGRILKVLWYLGKARVNPLVISQCMRRCYESDRLEVRRLLNWVPSWLSGPFVIGYWPEQFRPRPRSI